MGAQLTTSWGEDTSPHKKKDDNAGWTFGLAQTPPGSLRRSDRAAAWRRTHGALTPRILLQQLRLDDVRYQRHFRLSRPQFDDLLCRVGGRVSLQDTSHRV